MRTTSILLVAGALSGCSLLYDGSPHRGGSPDGSQFADSDTADLDSGSNRLDGGDSGPMIERDSGADPMDSSVGDSSAGDSGTADTGAEPVDAGCPDRDNDGYTDIACGGQDCDDTRDFVFPNAPPICNNNLVERCPGDALGVTLSDYGAGLETAGVIPPTTLLTAPGELSPKFGMALGASTSGAGTAMVIAMTRAGSFTRPTRIDIDLDSPRAAQTRMLIGQTGNAAETAQLGVIADVTGVDVRRLRENLLGVMITGSSDVASVVGWRGTVDLRSDTQDLRFIRGRSTNASSFGEPAVLGYFGLWRERGSPTALYGYALQDPPALSETTTGVPSGEARVVSSSGDFALLQQNDGELCFFGVGGDPVGCSTWNRQRGAAAFEMLGTGYLLTLSAGANLEMITYDCSSPPCVPAPRVSPIPVLATGADSSAAFDMAPLPTGNGLLVYAANHPDGDILYVQPILRQGGGGGDRLEVLNLRGRNLRVADAEVDIVENDDGISVAVVATISQNFAAMADSVVLTGVRGCAND